MSIFKSVPKIIQHDGKRYSLRLEGIFWSSVKDIADSKNIKSGALIAELAEKCDGINFSSYVRAYCMAEAGKKLISGSEGVYAVTALFETSPSPALIINRRGVIINVNPSFRKWFGKAEETYMNIGFTDIFSFIHYIRSFAETITSVTEKHSEKISLPVYHIAEDGNRINSLVSFADITAPDNDYTRIAIWFNTQPAVRIRLQ